MIQSTKEPFLVLIVIVLHKGVHLLLVQTFASWLMTLLKLQFI